MRLGLLFFLCFLGLQGHLDLIIYFVEVIELVLLRGLRLLLNLLLPGLLLLYVLLLGLILDVYDEIFEVFRVNDILLLLLSNCVDSLRHF